MTAIFAVTAAGAAELARGPARRFLVPMQGEGNARLSQGRTLHAAWDGHDAEGEAL